MAFLILLATLLLIGESSFARSKKTEDFPDYNRLEYTKELPPADQQLPDEIPGSIQMRVGEKKMDSKRTSLNEIPVSLRPAAKPNTSEPPMDFIDAPALTTLPSPDVSTPSVTTAPAQ
jgi:hypothetical protein